MQTQNIHEEKKEFVFSKIVEIRNEKIFPYKENHMKFLENKSRF